MRTVSIILLTSMLITGCGVDGPGSAASSVVSGDIASQFEARRGDYKLSNNDSFGAALQMGSVFNGGVDFSLDIVGRSVGAHNGSLFGTATMTESNAVFTAGDDCSVTLTPSGVKEITLVQTGTCEESGFGAFVDGSGRYVPTDSAKTLFRAVKGRELSLLMSESFSGGLKITSVSAGTVVFDLELVSRSEGAHHGVLTGARATLNAQNAVYQAGDDCTISLTPLGTEIYLAQSGTCEEAGFGAFVDATGTYGPPGE